MSEHAHAEEAPHAAHADAASHEKHYVKVWALLLVLLLISFVGPIIGGSLRDGGTITAGLARTITLITAFGIAVYKAWLVAKNFMHVTVQPRFVIYMLSTVLVFMLLFYAGTAPDVMEHEGANWAKPNPHGVIPERALHPEAHH
jgi:caa(3)-type oxidase subunit IV